MIYSYIEMAYIIKNGILMIHGKKVDSVEIHVKNDKKGIL